MNRQPAVTAGPQPHTTGLDETFAPDGKGKKRAAAKAEPVRTGPVRATVTVTDKTMDQNPEVECNDCGKKFCGGANRISRHIMEKCKCSTPALQKLKAKLIEEEANKATAKEKKQAIVEVDEAAEQPEKKFKIEGGLNQEAACGVRRRAGRGPGERGRRCLCVPVQCGMWRPHPRQGATAYIVLRRYQARQCIQVHTYSHTRVTDRFETY